jgi:hypothetical protein
VSYNTLYFVFGFHELKGQLPFIVVLFVINYGDRGDQLLTFLQQNKTGIQKRLPVYQ